MPAHASWKGSLRLSLVSVPVQAYSAELPASEIHLNQLHATCHSRIRYQKTCPVHGEVSKDEIVSGYEYAKGKYVIIDGDELSKLRHGRERSIEIGVFVPADVIDPLHFEGRTYFLVPDGVAAKKPYAVLLRAMTDERRVAIAQAVMSGKEQLVMVRPLESLLVLSLLHYETHLRKPEEFSRGLDLPPVSKAELKLAETLIEASSSDRPDLGGYEDLHTERLRQIIDAKLAGEKIVVPEAEEDGAVINLMDALRRSVAQAKGASHSTTAQGGLLSR